MELTSEQSDLITKCIDLTAELADATAAGGVDTLEYWDRLGAIIEHIEGVFNEMRPDVFGFDKYESGPLTIAAKREYDPLLAALGL